MRINTSAALKTDFDPTFPNLEYLRADDDRIPGRELGELVANGLRKRGFEVTGPTNEEPFFEVRCVSGEFTYGILCWIFQPEEADSVWAVDCSRKLGLLARLFGRSEDRELAAVVRTLDEIFRASPRVRAIRWFKDSVPFDAFEGGKGEEKPTYEY